MKKKIIGILIILIMLGAFIANHIITYAGVAQTPLYVNLMETDSKGIGYGIGDPSPEGGGKHIWNITTYGSDEKDAVPLPTEKQKNLYCVNADYGRTWFDGTTVDKEKTILSYELNYDIQNQADRAELAELNDDMLDNLLDLDSNTQGNKYKQLLWLFDNFYQPVVTEDNDKINDKIDAKIDEYLAKAGILKMNDGTETYYYNEKNRYPEGDPLTEGDIIAIQKMAVWYFTNNYKYTGLSGWLNILGSNGYTTLPASREAMAMDLYNYLVSGAVDGAENYNSTNNYKIDGAPASVNSKGLTLVDKKEEENYEKYIIEMSRKDDNCLIGPIVINKNNDLGYDIEILVKDQNGNKLTKNTDYIYVDKDGNKLEKTEKELVGLTEGFYVSVPRSKIENVSISVNISYVSTPKKLWLHKKEENGVVTINSEQPLVEITQDPQDITVELIAEPEEFDLALRKYVTALHDKDGNEKEILNARNLDNIDLGNLSTGTTATYKHRKDPVVVEEGDEVTYTIRIYNEGNKAGYASRIIDQLPTSTEFISSTNNKVKVVSKGKDNKDRNEYNLSYNTTTNQIILEIINTTDKPAQSLQPYTLNNLDYETIEIKCIVAREADTEKPITLTNVAWIDAAFNTDDNKEITSTVGADRDSEPKTIPYIDENNKVNKDNMENYRGSSSGNELTDSEYFYKGRQDDDDFEKVIIMPIEKVFDLALFKHIAAISKDQKIENGEYVTDTGNIDGTYLRAPVVTAIDPETGKITYKQDDKAALTVEPGDYVLYTIRVYNEGEINGYASKIKDTLPIGLEFVLDNEEYNGIWNLDGLDSDGRQVVSTTWYAKGQGAELDTVESDENYKANMLKALNKEGAISAENPDYLDAQVLCRVVEQATSDRVLVNYAQISDDSDENGQPIEDVDSTPDKWIDEDDDQDIERIKLQYFDLSLRKFITAVNDKELTDNNGKYIREPVVDVSNLANGTGTTAVYKHAKQSLAVQVGDRIVYTIRAYNEGSINGYASEVKDYLPPYLTYAENSEINPKYEWQISEDGRVVTTKYLAKTELDAFDGMKLDYADLKIECIVSNDAPLKQNQTNIAEISEYTYNDGTVEKDIDSSADNMEDKIPEDEKLPAYKDEELNKEYVPGNEDDDDFEKIYVKEFDFALRKFITQVQDKEVTTRVPQVDITPLKNGENTATYTHPKDALIVHVGDVVIYSLRAYNEGEISGYASEITDDIPEYLEYLPEDSINTQYMWKMYDENGKETENVEEAVKVKTQYLSKENGEDKIIKAFDGTTLDYKDIKIAFKVKDPNSNTHIITNHAQISNDADENGNPVDDKDSKPDKWNEGEDDQDIENVKVEYFDLSLLKFVSKVFLIEDGKETITETGYNGHEEPEPVVKVELHKKKLNQVVVKFAYGITITNEGDIAGYATEITDYIPEGLRFDPTDNPEWMDEGNNVISTRQLENTLLQPGESATIEVIFTWINSPNNLAQKTNTAEISEDKNEFDVPDRDSTPDNKVEGEDDIDIAKVILAIKTGAGQTYFTLTLGLLGVVLVGVVLIKKFVI